MNITKLALALLAITGAGCTTVPPAPTVAANCFDSNYNQNRKLFTLKNVAGNPVNQQCLLRVYPRGAVASASGLTAGRYRVYLSNGGGGGGASSMGIGGTGGGETSAHKDIAPVRGSLGSGGGGGEGHLSECEPGAPGGHGYIALRPV